jgi:hypothetical protein
MREQVGGRFERLCSSHVLAPIGCACLCGLEKCDVDHIKTLAEWPADQWRTTSYDAVHYAIGGSVGEPIE